MALTKPAFKPKAIALSRHMSGAAASQRILSGIAIGLGCLALVAGSIDPGLSRTIRTQVTDLTAPLLEFASRPTHALNASLAKYENWQNLAAENERLKLENERLRGWHAEATRLTHENTDLRQLVAAKPRAASHYISAPVIGEASGGYVRSIIVSAGLQDGIDNGQAVRTGSGVVGQVTEASDSTARILLLTDMNARLPVLLEGSRSHAMLVGDNTSQPVLRYLDEKTMPKLGERLVTSGTGGLMPKGLPVGVVTSVEDGLVRITLSADLEALNMVSVIDYGLSPATAEAK
ncbi:MAG: rod shape-determining protein MreC [Alphaproteobacteria bacterium]